MVDNDLIIIVLTNDNLIVIVPANNNIVQSVEGCIAIALTKGADIINWMEDGGIRGPENSNLVVVLVMYDNKVPAEGKLIIILTDDQDPGQQHLNFCWSSGQ